MQKQKITLERGVVDCYKIPLHHAAFILLKAKKGYVMCGYLNMETANTLGDVAGMITGVRTIEDAFNAQIQQVSENAKNIGLTSGMPVKQFLNTLC